MSDVAAMIERARELLVDVEPVARPWQTLGAALLAATAAVSMAGVVILGTGFSV